ncbi:hypothetical protein [Arthrobacter sp.]
MDCALRSLSAHRRYLETLSDRRVEEQAVEQLALVTGGRPRISSDVFGL